MITRLLPHPRLALLLTLIWLVLVDQPGLGSLVLGSVLGLLTPLLTAPYWPGRPSVPNLPRLAAYVALVGLDIVISNLVVARLVLFMPNARLRPAWISVPLELTSPEAIAVLTATITLTPGTVCADLSGDGRALLIHCLHAPDPDALRAAIKSRYEARLQRIFA
ncbi:MAG: Na+/H+ antiporter subunit E [Pseudorhodobacter sp.]|nr:Na+/H+ antiporter subunit E [Pseudorhodobacter sp.]